MESFVKGARYVLQIGEVELCGRFVGLDDATGMAWFDGASLYPRTVAWPAASVCMCSGLHEDLEAPGAPVSTKIGVKADLVTIARMTTSRGTYRGGHAFGR